jgi:tetratricopeptide (TPR) repeat protein
MTAVERMEKRIYELEHTASPAVSVTAATAASSTPANDTEARRAASPVSEQASRITGLLGKGRSLLAAGKAKEAVACYNEILKLDINHPEALVRRGAALERLKQDDEAIQCYDRAIKADRKMTLAYLYKGGVCNRLERYEEALKCYELALQVEEEDREPGSPRSALSAEDWTARRGIGAS